MTTMSIWRYENYLRTTRIPGPGMGKDTATPTTPFNFVHSLENGPRWGFRLTLGT